MIKAEDEVVAIILSAIVGNIIESWNFIQFEENKTNQDGQSKSISDVIVNNGSADLSRNKEGSTDSLCKNCVDSKPSKRVFSKKHSSKLTFGEHDYTFENVKDIALEKLSNESGECNSLIFPVIVQDGQQNVNIKEIIRSLFKREKEKIFGWKFLDTNQQVCIVFKQGNRYDGKLSNCKMHGPGKFSWADGSFYKGSFLNGEMTGEGYLQWPDQSWYEGELLHGFRNGIGLFVMGQMFYVGTWKCGLRQGLGTMYYGQRDTKVNYYNGEWYADKKHGTALRSYKTGAMYSGEWQLGMRHGLGTMVWTSSDVYSGNWNKGLTHGYGEYTWDTFFNQQLVVPQENCYYGEWYRGIRHGKGTLETSSGVSVCGTWDNGKKCGPAKVVCSNGNFIYAENLFFEDNISLSHEGLSETDSLLDTSTHSSYLIKVPVNSPSHQIDLSFYTERLEQLLCNCSKTWKTCLKYSNSICNYINLSKYSCNTFFEYETISPTYSKHYNINSCKVDVEFEENSLRNIILQYLSTLRMVYSNYSELCCETKPKFSSVLIRLMFWQMIRDCNLHDRGFSLAHFDLIFADNKVALFHGIHCPFERLQFWQFLHCIIELSWELYGKHCYGTPNIPGILASALHKFIVSDILPNVGKHKGHALLKYRNLLSLKSVYQLYKSIGEPHSARKLLKEFMGSNNKSYERKHTPSTFFEHPEHLIHGKNIIGVGGQVTYYPRDECLVPTIKRFTEHLDLSYIKSMGLLTIFDCIKEICPSINSKNTLVNMDYKIVFLEFFEILLLCAKLHIKMNKNNKVKDVVEQILKNSYEILNTTAEVELFKEESKSLEKPQEKKLNSKKIKKKK